MSDKWTINLPTFDVCLSSTGRCEVTHNSSSELRNALEQFARYFKAELGYDKVQYFADEHDEACIGFLFTESAMDLCTNEHEEMPTRCTGGCCFRRVEYRDGPHWVLYWVWVHPFARDRGVLSRHWKHFRSQFGEFIVEYPLSRAMQAFLDQHERRKTKQ